MKNRTVSSFLSSFPVNVLLSDFRLLGCLCCGYFVRAQEKPSEAFLILTEEKNKIRLLTLITSLVVILFRDI